MTFMGEPAKYPRIEFILKVATLLVAIFIGIKQLEIMRQQNAISARQVELIEASSVLLLMPAPHLEYDSLNETLVLENTGSSPFFVIATDLPWETPRNYKPIPVAPGRKKTFRVNTGHDSWRANGMSGIGYRGNFVLLSPAGERYLVECDLVTDKGMDDIEARFLWVVSEKAVEADRRR